MPPFDYLPQFPALAQVLSKMSAGVELEASDKEQVKTAAQAEIVPVLSDTNLVCRIGTTLFDTCLADLDIFLNRTGEAYHYLGVSDTVRSFVGEVWTELLKTWTDDRQVAFLNRIHAKSGHDLFSALDFLPLVFRTIRFPAKETYDWIAEVHRRIGTDLYQRGIVQCLRNIAEFHTDRAIEIVELWIGTRGPAPQRAVIAFLLAQIRRLDARLTAAQHARLDAISRIARTRGSSSLRVMELDSWANYVASPMLDETFTLGLREMVEIGGVDELRSWARLLSNLASLKDERCGWVHRELLAIAKAEDHAVREWIAAAAVSLWIAADGSDKVTKQNWEQLFHCLHPIKKEETTIWRKFEESLVDSLPKDEMLTLECLILIASGSGSEFAKRLESKRGDFVWFCGELERSPAASRIVSHMCFHSARKVRRIGLRLMSNMEALMLDENEVQRASADQLELLILELPFLPLNYETAARVHAGIVSRVTTFGGELEIEFADHVRTDALNTNKYRTLLAEKCPGNAWIKQLLEETTTSIRANAEAAKSPALQMEVPGYRRAAELSMRHFARTVAAGTKEFSIIAQFATTIQLLYGKKWRIYRPNGEIGEASGLHQSGVNMEMPRLDFMRPEEMRIRRMGALARIKELDAPGSHEGE